MKFLVTGSAGHLGEALMRTLRADASHEVLGVDVKASPYTDVVGSVADRAVAARCMEGVQAVLHTATLHKPHVATHTRQQFVDTNITGTLNLLEEAVAHGVRSFVFTSTTSAFGDALTLPPGEPATWITESVSPVPKNIYGVTKVAAENLCRLFHRNQKLACVVLRTSRFFPEDDDNRQRRAAFDEGNLKANEFLYRRVDVADVVSAHLLAAERAPDIGFDTFIISATTPLWREDLAELRFDPAAVLRRRVPQFEGVYAAQGWRAPLSIDRVYVNEHARRVLGWEPEIDFAQVLARVQAGRDYRSALAVQVGSKGYHDEVFADGPFPVED